MKRIVTLICVLVLALMAASANAAIQNTYCGHGTWNNQTTDKVVFQYHYNYSGTHWHTVSWYVKDYVGDPTWRFVRNDTHKCPS
jgi:hypothetical protein